MHVGHMVQVIERKRYDTDKATLICSNAWWDGHNHERSGTNCFLYRTPGGAYFFARLTQWQGSHDRLEACDEGEAIEFFEACEAHDMCEMSFEEAFPGVKVEDA